MTLLARRLEGVKPPAAQAVIRGTAACTLAEPVAGTNGQMLIVTLKTNEPGFTTTYGVAVWQSGGQWRSASLLDDPIGNGLVLEQVHPAGSGFEAIARYRVDGTGQIGGFRLLRFGQEMTQLWQGPELDHFTGRILSDRLLLATYRDPIVYKEPHSFSGNCCYPSNGQTLWERQGDRFVEKASRAYPSPLYTASAFAGAWNKGGLDLAATRATGPNVPIAMLNGAATPPTLELTKPSDALYKIDDAEAAYWEALPPEFRGPKPTETELVWPATPRPLRLKRVNGEWQVAGWQ